MVHESNKYPRINSYGFAVSPNSQLHAAIAMKNVRNNVKDNMKIYNIVSRFPCWTRLTGAHVPKDGHTMRQQILP